MIHHMVLPYVIFTPTISHPYDYISRCMTDIFTGSNGYILSLPGSKDIHTLCMDSRLAKNSIIRTQLFTEANILIKHTNYKK